MPLWTSVSWWVEWVVGENLNLKPSIPSRVAKILDFSESCVIGQFCTAACSRHPFFLPSLRGPLLFLMHTHVLPKRLGTCTCTYSTTLPERKNWIQSRIFTQEFQNDSYTFTQFSIKWNPIFLVKFQTGERACGIIYKKLYIHHNHNFDYALSIKTRRKYTKKLRML